MGVTDVTVGVTVTSRLHRSYCCSRIPLLFCCYCSTLQHCSVPNVNVPYKKVLPLYVHVRHWVFVPFLMCLYLGTSALSCGPTAGIATRILRSPLLKTFGGYSFGIYLWQEPMFRLLAGTLGCKEISSREGVVFYIIMLLAYSVMWTDLVELPIVRSFRKLLQPCLPPNKVIFETDEMAQSASPFGTRRGRPASSWA